MASNDALDPVVIAALNAQREGFGDELSNRLADGITQAVDDYLASVVEEANGTNKMEGPALREVAKAAVLALITVANAQQQQLDAPNRTNAGAGMRLGRGLGR
jgi:hypothetical protein